MLGMTLGTPALNRLALVSVQRDMAVDFPGAIMRWGLSQNVGEVIKSFTAEQIVMLSKRCSQSHLLTLRHGDDQDFWYRIRSAVSCPKLPAGDDDEDPMDSLLSASVPMSQWMFTPSMFRVFVLSAISGELSDDLVGVCLRWRIDPRVARVIVSMSAEQIRRAANVSGLDTLVSFANANNFSYWDHLARALTHKDTAGVDFALLSRMFLPSVHALAQAA